MWQPMTKFLCDQAKDYAKEGKKVAIGFAVWNRLMRDYIVTQIPEIAFIEVDVPLETLVDR